MTNDSFAERLKFLGITDEVKATLREAKPFIDSALPEILSGFYAHVGTHPELARMFSGKTMMDRAKGLQTEHWALITSAEFDEAYVASVRKIGEVHNRVGLEPRWYIGGYAFISCAILEAISSHLSGGALGSKASRRAAWLSALNRAVMLDMDIAISVYLDAGKRERRELLTQLAAHFESSVSGVIASVSGSAAEMQSSAGVLTGIAQDTKDKARVVAAAAGQATHASAGVAAASEQLCAAIGEIGAQIHKTTTVTSEATGMAQAVSGSMHGLLVQTQSIGKVSEFINDVAGQINLLALNATIESARAGEAGKGFAVVASEVKNLASQTTKASEEIGQQVARIQEATSAAAAQITRIVDIISTINTNISSIAAAAEQQSAATREIAKNVNNSTQASQQVAGTIAVVEQGADNTNLSSAEVLSSATQLSGQTAMLRERVNAFLASIQAN